MSSSTTRRFKAVPALLLALAVLVVGVAGTATAAKLITGKQIKNETITAKDVKNGSLKEADLKAGVKAKLNAPSVKGYEVVTETVTVGSGSQETVYVACTAGKVVTAGGSLWENTSVETAIISSLPQRVIRGDALLFDDPQPGFADGWKVEARHNGLDPQDLTGYAICVNPV
ncbi:MAG TPA: hypothetical protein VFO49_11340 [Nocardioides sp.]|nr:hypothetical protein [Nocardioides sp.]